MATSAHIGRTYGQLTILDVHEVRRTPKGGHVQMMLTRCTCGEERITTLTSLTRGKCYACKTCVRPHRHKVGYRHPLYATYRAMLSRCQDPGYKAFKDYGGRGIQVCDRWSDTSAPLQGFARFVDDMGPRPAGTSLDRRDNNGPYDPANCRWATAEEQQNNRRDNTYITAAGRTLTLTAWSRELDISTSRIEYARKHGFSDAQIIEVLLDRRAQGLYGSVRWVALNPQTMTT